ncbi:LysE family translocator [Paracandidimonas soli]|uniref:Threonine/homoserine/homoserine lactone efflux protein n=1 Tax=Paracandidimonas soli TaxID=1917182 RepID=A0A4R3V523_9BURK|nr:LysE family transporter [Paracandidimonas soli]TCU98443.1 threonine/homoserine/homoserine lactone efflux protein [Paracandidimonas soli]
MDYLPQLLTLSGIILLACASPGPDFVAVTSHALHDRRAGMFVGLGIACAVILWAALAILGFGLLIKEMFWLYETIRVAGAVYLSYLGIRMLASALKKCPHAAPSACSHPRGRFLPRERPGGKKTPSEGDIVRASAASAGQAWRRGLLVGLTNPKTATFFATLFVTLLPAGAPAWVYISVVGLTGAITGIWLGLLAAFFSVKGVQSVYMRIRRPVDALMGAALLGLGMRMAASR